ncbi:hypothetical protein PspLS_07160 [Pyricularia sp. CBS 133598]|nr:hypothetical protein PspLS_07160 [Pyricularia sp. CBS 133598]
MASALTRVGLPPRRPRTPANVIWGVEETRGEETTEVERPLSDQVRALCGEWDEIEDSQFPIFVLIDGLDEVSDKKDRMDLIKALEHFRGLRYVKVCRPEGFFQESFKNEQQLRLQDLTKGDMEKEASAILQDWSEKYEEQKVTDLREALVRKAEGVFLWLHLAGLRLKERFCRDDTINELEQCLEALPIELHKLYEEIQQIAAHYINILLHLSQIRTGADLYPDLLLATFTTYPGRRLLLDRSKADVHPSILVTHHKDMQKSITNRCAGIFQVTDRGSVLDSEVNPIHRSAFEFFVDTEEGLKIRGFDPCPHDQTVTEILEGYLALDRFNFFADWVGVKTALNIIRRHIQIPKQLLRAYTRLIQPLRSSEPRFFAHILSWVLMRGDHRRYIISLGPDAEQSDSQYVRQCVQKSIEQCRRPKALASWIFRETVLYQDKDITDMLLGQGVDIWARGVAGGEFWSWSGHKFSRDVVIYTSVGAQVLFEIWKDKSSVKSASLILTALNFEPGECVPLKFCYRELWDGDTAPDDSHDSDISADYVVTITLKANLAFLIELLEPSGALPESFLSMASSAPPSVSLPLVSLSYSSLGKRAKEVLFVPSDDNVSDLIAQEIRRLLMVEHSNGHFRSSDPMDLFMNGEYKLFANGDCMELESGSLPETHNLIHGFLQNPNDCFKHVDEPAQHWLARHDCGYRMVKDFEPWELDELDMCIAG